MREMPRQITTLDNAQIAIVQVEAGRMYILTILVLLIVSRVICKTDLLIMIRDNALNVIIPTHGVTVVAVGVESLIIWV
jgi:hypothetical protein